MLSCSARLTDIFAEISKLNAMTKKKEVGGTVSFEGAGDPVGELMKCYDICTRCSPE